MSQKTLQKEAQLRKKDTVWNPIRANEKKEEINEKYRVLEIRKWDISLCLHAGTQDRGETRKTINAETMNTLSTKNFLRRMQPEGIRWKRTQIASSVWPLQRLRSKM